MAKVTCPSCKRYGDMPDGLDGKRVRCQNCGERFRVPSPTAETVAYIYASDLVPYEEPAPLVARAVTPERTTKDCSFCGEEILATARKCKHCGELLDPALRAEEEMRRAVAQAPVVQSPVYYAPPQPMHQSVVVKTVVRNSYQVPHVLHLLLTVLTCGLWLPIWIIHALLNIGNDR